MTFMDHNSQDKLATLIHGELMKLSDRPAPGTLIPGVLARLERRERQWWRQPLPVWPMTARILALPVMVASAALMVAGLYFALESRFLQGMTGAATGVLQPFTPFWEFVVTLVNAGVIVLSSFSQHWLLAAAGVVFLMYLTCVALGAMCFQVLTRTR